MLMCLLVVNTSRDEWRDIYRKTAQSARRNLNPRNSANSFSMESGGFIAFFEEMNLNVDVLTCIKMCALYTMNYFVRGLMGEV